MVECAQLVLEPVRAAARAGRFEHAKRLAIAVREAYPQLPRVGAEADLELAYAQMKLGEMREANDAAARTAELATSWGDDSLAARAWLAAVDVATLTGAMDDARRHLRSAAASLHRIDASDAELELTRREAAIAIGRGDGGTGEAQLLRALDLLDPDTDPVIAATLHNNLGAAYGDRGALDLAIAQFERALELRSHALAPDHPDVAGTRLNLGAVLLMRGDTEQGLAVLRGSVTEAERTYGPDHREVARAATFLAGSRGSLGQLDACVRVVQRALEITERIDDRSIVRVDALRLAADCHLELGGHESSERWAARAVAMGEQIRLKPIDDMNLHETYARAAWANGHRDTALRAAGRAQALAVTVGSVHAARIARWLATPPTPRRVPSRQ